MDKQQRNIPIMLEEQKQLMVNILDYVHKFCKKHGIAYFISAGTLIGAIRHKGFIPWDDDVDIAMPRKDYDRFLELFEKEAEYPFKLECLETNYRYYLPYAKVIDNRTVLREHAKGSCNIGVFIDVFPMDYITDETKLHVDDVLHSSAVLTAMEQKPAAFNENHSLLNKISTPLRRLLGPIRSRYLAWMYRKREKFAEKNETPWMICLYGRFGAAGVSPATFFSEFIEVPFENITVMAPARYDEYLRHLYGDYMVLPAKDKQVSHHQYDVYWKKKNRGTNK